MDEDGRADDPQSSDGVQLTPPPDGPPWGLADPTEDGPSVLTADITEPYPSKPTGPSPQPTADPPWELGDGEPAVAFPTPRSERPGQRAQRVLVALLAVVVVVALAGGLMWWMRPPDVPVAPPASTGVATTYPSSSPITMPEPVVHTSGGQLGELVAYSTAAGSATIRVVRATWTTQGVAPPPLGCVYLVVDVEFTGRSGAPVAGEGVLLVRDASGRGQSPAFGPGDQGVPTGVLAPGETLTGQVGFAVRPGGATLAVLDPNLLDVASVAIPGP